MMQRCSKLQNLEEYFTPRGKRQCRGGYVTRICGYSPEIRQFIKRYYKMAKKCGVVLEGKIPNPDEKQLAYYCEIMGRAFQMDQKFLTASLRTWLPRMSARQIQDVAETVSWALQDLKNGGKTENMLRNAYIKWMCWLYYRFEPIFTQRGGQELPKILYEGNIGQYEVILLSILAAAGCDVVILVYLGETEYQKTDSHSRFSNLYWKAGLEPFPQDFSLKQMEKELAEEFERERLYGQRPSIQHCTNVWMEGQGLEELKKPPSIRGKDSGWFYNAFCRIRGVEDKLTYEKELFALKQKMEQDGRKLVIVDQKLPGPTPEETVRIKRKAFYSRLDQMLLDLTGNLSDVFPGELQRVARKAFVDVILESARENGENRNRLTSQALYLLCWLKRYGPQLFANWKFPETACFIHMGGCKTEAEARFLSCLARMPVDVLILCPDKNDKCCLKDPHLQEISYPEGLALEHFPRESVQTRIGTAAFFAERDLDETLYKDTGLFRNQQYGRADVVRLRTMYEEIKLLWDQELVYRPGFETSEKGVTIPVIFAKVCGIKDRDLNAYWHSIGALLTETTLLITQVPYLPSASTNLMKAYAPEFFKNGKLQRKKIKEHPKYPYRILREEVQEFLLDNLELMIRQKLVKGIGENGTEYTVIAQILNLPKEVLRLIQKFDFTKKNPKMIYINPTEKEISLEDSIMTVFLSCMGFDILFFVPTGYQSVERYICQDLMEEHQIGEYQYDLQVPNLRELPPHIARPSWRDKFFKRGNRHGA